MSDQLPAMILFARGCGPDAHPYIGPCPTHEPGMPLWFWLVLTVAVTLIFFVCLVRAMTTQPEHSPSTARFTVDQYENGQIYVSEDGVQMLHAEILGQHEAEIQIGVGGKVTVNKLYGPLIFWEIRISCDFDTCEWVIERSCGPMGIWREWTRIPGQLDEDFTKGPL